MASAVTVIGAGIFGLACAWECQRRGARVRVIEARHVGAGSSGGTVGALAPHAPENWNAKKQMQLDALVAAESWWAEISAAGGVDPGYARTGRIQPITDETQLQRIRDRIAEAGVRWPAPFGMALTEAPLTPLLPVSETGLFVTDNLTARLSPRRAGAALAAAIRAGGGLIEEDAGPQSPDMIKGPAIWATGVHGLAALSADLGRNVGGGVKGQSALLAHDVPDAPQTFADGLHVVPHADGTVAIGSTSERDFTDPGDTDNQLEALIERARTLCPTLADAPVIDRWAGVRPRAASRAPLLGNWPGRPDHFIANGGFKIGFAMAPVAAALLADLVIEGIDRIPDAFRLT